MSHPAELAASQHREVSRTSTGTGEKKTRKGLSSFLCQPDMCLHSVFGLSPHVLSVSVWPPGIGRGLSSSPLSSPRVMT